MVKIPDVIKDAVRVRFLSHTANDDLWTKLISAPGNTFARRDTEFVRVNLDTLVVHVQQGDRLRSFAIKVVELEDDPEPQQTLEV